MTLDYSRQRNNANNVLCHGGCDVAHLIHDKLGLYLVVVLYYDELHSMMPDCNEGLVAVSDKGGRNYR